MCVRAYVYACIRPCVHTCMPTCMHAGVCVCVHVLLAIYRTRQVCDSTKSCVLLLVYCACIYVRFYQILCAAACIFSLFPPTNFVSTPLFPSPVQEPASTVLYVPAVRQLSGTFSLLLRYQADRSTPGSITGIPIGVSRTSN